MTTHPTDRKYAEASLATADNLRSIATSQHITQLSPLTLPQINSVVNLISEVLPAGNIPGIILSNLVNHADRRPPPEAVRRDINLLYQGLEQTVARVKHGAKFAGPAAVLWGYQNLLKLAGKEPETAFPEGLWQFYVAYAFREDTAHYTSETQAFATLLRRHDIHLQPVLRISAWVMAAGQLLHQYHDLLTNWWRERVYLALLQQVGVGNLHEEWAKIRPFGRGQEADPSHNYTAYRRAKFDQFLRGVLAGLDEQTHYQWNQLVQAAKPQLAEFLRQRTLLAYVEPSPHSDQRQPLPPHEAHVGLVYQNRYYLLPICQQGTAEPVDVATIVAQVSQLVARPTGTAALPLSVLANLRREAWAELRPTLNATLQENLHLLRRAPIIFNADQQAGSATLNSLRQAERGVGDHPLTIFDGQRTTLFDANHLFVDGHEAAEIAEIVTQEALAWAVYLHQVPQPALELPTSIRPLMFPFERTEQIFIQQAPQATAELTSESHAIQIKPVVALQKMFRMRSDLLHMSIHDLLVLYRALHNFTYQPDPDLVQAVAALKSDRKLYEAAEGVEAMWAQPQNPGLLIPLAAVQDPRERIYPLLFEVPVRELKLLQLHQETTAALITYETAEPHDRLHTYTTFDKHQRDYLATLAGFAQILAAAKEMAQRGTSRGQEVVRLTAGLPPSLKKLFEQMSNRSEVLNNVLKGSELFEYLDFSAVPNSLTRFMAGKEDSEQKTLVWSGLLDAQGNLGLTLRDFRPELLALAAGGRQPLAKQISEHYLVSYGRGFNSFIGTLRRITKASRETQLVPPPRGK